MHHGYGTGSSPAESRVARVEPDRLDAAAVRFAEIAAELEAGSASVPVWAPAAGFASAAAAAERDADLVAATRAHAGRARALGDALRGAAAAWRTADDAVAATFTR